jgi:hypothetical protein
MSNQQTDNSYFLKKVEIRKKFLPQKNKINVLDCYAGKGLIWNNIKKIKNINVISIDKKKNKNIDLVGDNRKYLKKINLNEFDIIDLDAYGMPDEQLDIIMNKSYEGIIFITFISISFGRLSNNILCSLGYTKNMIKKCPTLFSKNNFTKFCYFLRKKGIKKIYYVSVVHGGTQKYYIYTNTKNYKKQV